MSEDKKPKIDLKARLGKKTVSAPVAGGSIPPPAGIPAPSIPSASGIPRPSGLGSGIPAPPFQSAPSRPAPAMDPSNPYGAMAPQAAPLRAAPTAITIEMSDEVIAAQKKGRSKVAILALVTAGVGGVLGFTVGSGAERGKAADAALVGASELAKDVAAANIKIEELADTLKAAKEKLSKSTFPDEEVSKLGSLNIPFAGSNLAGRGIGRFKPELISMLVSFASASAEANDQKEAIQNVLNNNKKGVQDFLDSLSKPQVRWSVVVAPSPLGPMASMQPVPAPFLMQSDQKGTDGKAYAWPESFNVTAGGKQVAVKRYTTGNAATEEPTFIPVDPTTQSAVCPSDVLVRLRRELNDMEEVLRGNPTPGEEKAGLLDQGKTLANKLKDLGKAAG